MINTTILSLNILSLASYSPFYTMYNINKGKLCFSLCNSQISYLFNSVIQSYTRNHQTLIKNTIISHTLNSAIKFSSEGETSSCSIFPNFPFKENAPIDNKEFNGKTCTDGDKCHLSFNGNCGDLIITKCTFKSCNSDESGGSISIIQDCIITIHGTIFDDSNTKGRFGGAIFIIKSKGKDHDKASDLEDGQIQKLDVQYCCFSNCYGGTNLMGVAIMCAADQMMLYFASTTNCPDNSEKKAEGAQFDIQAKNVTSHHVNCSGGYSNYCGGIEYRHASTGFFKYQTITGITCMFGVSYTKLTEKSALENGIELSDSNIIGIKLNRAVGLGDANVHSGLIHVRQTAKITIENFCFIDCNLDDNNDNQRIISKGTKDGPIQSIKVIFKNCYYDCQNNMIALDTSSNMLETIGCVENTKTLNEINQLLLGECQGNEEPVPFTPTNSKGFSNSDYFSKSDYFTKSNVFTYSQKFDATEFFSKSGIFTESISFTSNDPPGKSVDKDKPNPGMIAGISVGAVAAVAIIAIVAFFIIRKRRMIPDGNDLETFDENTGSVTNSNPIYGKGEDDPFKEDFK